MQRRYKRLIRIGNKVSRNRTDYKRMNDNVMTEIEIMRDNNKTDREILKRLEII